MPKALSLVGQKFGRLKSISGGPPIKRKDGRFHTSSICLCDCGKEVIVRNTYLMSGNTTSCGCFNISITVARSTTHGQAGRGTKSGAYRAWQAMNQRCSPGVANAKNYSERGIRVCKRWRKFENFFADMGERPLGMTVERINNNGIYEPSNVRWATRIEQGRNKRNNRIWTINGVTGCTVELADHFGLPRQVVYTRLHRGWEPQVAFTAPVGFRPKRPKL